MKRFTQRVIRSKCVVQQQQLVRNLDIQEFQAKELMGKYNVRHQRGYIATNTDEIPNVCQRVAQDFNSDNFIVKSQILAGGRGKGVFNTGYKGGVKFCKDADAVSEAGKNMLGNRLITKQTGKNGTQVNTIMVTECLEFSNELYFAIVLDRETDGPVIIASYEGGMDIEEVAESNPDAIVKLPISLNEGVTDQVVDTLAEGLKLTEQREKLENMVKGLYNMFMENDMTQLEINPLVETDDHELVCVDGKVNIDDNAFFRQKELFAMEDPNELDSREVEANKYDLNYVALDGNIGCMVNGAGLAMSTMDIIKLYGGEPANFLDVGGSATPEQVIGAFNIITNDPSVKCILVNIFGGIMRCDVIAQGIVEAAKTLDLKVPLVVRLAGTNVEKGLEILDNSGLNIIGAKDLDEAASKSVEAIQN